MRYIKYLFLLAFSPLIFAGTETWYNFEVDEKTGKNTKAVLYKAADGEPGIGVQSDSFELCKEFEDNYEEVDPLEVNGTLVKMSFQCLGLYKGVFFPSTFAGSDFVIKEFLSKKVVTFTYPRNRSQQFIFSAMGFTKYHKKLINEIKQHKSAL